MFQLLVVSVSLKCLIICAGVQTTVEEWRNGNFSRQWARKIFLSFYFLWDPKCGRTYMISCGHRKDIFEVTGNSVRWLFTWNEIRYKALTHDRVLLRPEEHRAWISFQYLKSIKPHLCHYRCSSDHRADCSSYKQIHVVFYLLISHTNNFRARAAGNSGLTVITTTTSNGVYTSWISRFWTLFCHGLMAVLLSLLPSLKICLQSLRIMLEL